MNKSFEEALKELKAYSDKIKKKDISLDEAIECYENGIKSYEACKEILENAKRNITVYEMDDEI